MLNPSWLEVALFLAMALASGVLFYRRISPIARTILRSKRDPGFSLDPLGKRAWEFLWEVLLQAKVIQHRPLPGLAHAFVFWGFCAFALVTLDHLVQGLGGDLLTPHGPIGSLYFGLAAIFALLVSVSIAGLAVRRFIVRPRWLGEKVSTESGFIALLILTLMLTFLATFYIEEGTAPGRVNWWLHTAALLVFLPLLPQTKHLHLLLSPVTVFLSRGGFSRIPPLDGDEDFGVQSGKDVTQLMALQAFSCVECGRCTEHCPAANTGKELNPKEIALGLRRYLRENGAANEKPLVGEYISEEALFQCTSCGACEYQCPVGIEHLPIIQGLRRGRVNTGEWENEYGGKLFLALERNGNSLGMALSERQKFIEKNGIPWFDGSQEYCLWLGCMGAYDPQGREIVLALVKVLRHLGVTFGVLRKEKCSGDAVRRLGNDLLFGQLAEANLETIRTAKAAKLLSICPHCVRTLSEDWAEAGGTVVVEHHSEFLARHAERLPVWTAPAAAPSGKTVFHDPCYLGRYRGVYEEPRAVASKSGELLESARSRDRSFCCGAGGGMAFLGEEKGARVSHERATELAATGASLVAAACPFCATMFRDALVQIGPTAPKLMDIAQIAAAGIEADTQRGGATPVVN